MNKDSDQSVPWWKEKRELSLARKQVQRRRDCKPAKAGDSFLIVTEGKVTELVYFEQLREDLQLTTVKVEIVPGKSSKNDPRRVIRTASEKAKELAQRARRKQIGVTELEKYDHVWAVVDSDVAYRGGFWTDVEELAKARGVNLAYSTPCFEYWLLLHVSGYTTRSDLFDGDSAKKVLEHALGEKYSTNRKTAQRVIASLLPKWPDAVKWARRVREHHRTVQSSRPHNPSTEVDLLAYALNCSSAPHKQKVFD